MKLKLPSGATGFTNDAGQWVCTGSQMGRRDVLPEDRQQPIKLRLQRLPFVDDCYDRWGAYWGAPANVWCAWYHKNTTMTHVKIELFFRADSRQEAKAKVRATLPNAKFYR